MKRNRVVAAAQLTLGVLLPALAGVPAVATPDDVVQVSGDGSTFARTYDRLFEDQRLIPLERTTDAFTVLNTGDDAGFFTIWLRDVDVPDEELLNALGISATTEATMRSVPFRAAEDCVLLLGPAAIAAGQAVPVETVLQVDNLDGRAGQGVPVSFTLEVVLADQPVDSCAPNFVQPPPSAPLPTTGVQLLAVLALAAIPLVGGLIAILVSFIRRARQGETKDGQGQKD